MDLICPKSQRLLIFSAFFGTSLQAPHECSMLSASQSGPEVTHHDTSKKGGNTVCQSPKANELVMNRCQGQKQCRLTATFDEFGWTDCARSMSNAIHSSHLHLKVVYNCAPKEVLRDSLVAARPIRSNSTDRSASTRSTLESIGRPANSIDTKVNASQSNGFVIKSGNSSKTLFGGSSSGSASFTSPSSSSSTTGAPTTSTTTDYSGFVDAPRYDSNANDKNKAQPETAANYKTHSLDSTLTDEVKQSNDRVWSDWVSLYRYLERKSLCPFPLHSSTVLKLTAYSNRNLSPLSHVHR
jgi:hypothetical protein